MINNRFFLYLILLFTFILHGTFLNTYIIIRNNYSERMLKYGGFCEPYGYGFVQSLYKNYNLKFNFDIKNYSDLPSINYYFYKFKNENKKNYLALIGISDDQFNKFYKSKYKIIEKKGNCYFLLKND